MKQLLMKRKRLARAPALESLAGTHSASVVARSDDGRSGVRIAGATGSTIWARSTAECDPRPGDRVLITITEEGEAFVVARLGPANVSRGLQTSSGARVEVVGDDAEERIQVRDPEGALLFEYDAASGRSAIFAAEGDLSLNAPNGRIELAASKGVQCVSEGPILIQSRVHVGLRTTGESRESGASFNLIGTHADLVARRLVAVAQSGEMRISRLRYRGERIDATIKRVRMIADRIETVAKWVVERLERTDRRVENTDRRRAGRVVDEIDGMHYVTSGETTVRARGTYRLDGEQINLG